MAVFYDTLEEILPHIKDSRLKLPEDVNNYNPEEYPHLKVFLNAHLQGPLIQNEILNNANMIADIPEEKIRNGKVSMAYLLGLGCKFDWGGLTEFFKR